MISTLRHCAVFSVRTWCHVPCILKHAVLLCTLGCFQERQSRQKQWGLRCRSNPSHSSDCIAPLNTTRLLHVPIASPSWHCNSFLFFVLNKLTRVYRYFKLNRGKALLYGPGSIHHAHSRTEKIGVAEIRDAVDAYKTIVRACLARSSS